MSPSVWAGNGSGWETDQLGSSRVSALAPDAPDPPPGRCPALAAGLGRGHRAAAAAATAGTAATAETAAIAGTAATAETAAAATIAPRAATSPGQ